MKNKNEIFSIYLQEFVSYRSVKLLLNPNFDLKDNNILESLEQTKERFIKILPEIELQEAEKLELINKIKSLYYIYQEEGHVILGDYNHDYEWYDKLLNSEGYDQYYWNRYKNYLLNTKHFSSKIVDILENKTLKSIMSYLGNPLEENTTFSIRGLVVGDVQSGKTSNYLGLLSKAADAGYKVIFILTGTIESLRKQTQIRVEEGFIGYDSVNGVDVGVGRGEKLPKAFTSRAKDFTSGDNQNTTYKISDYSSEPMIFVVKKNVPVLKKIYSSLKLINTNGENGKINFPMLMIDDEADNASINTNKKEDDPTKINKYIRNILSLFTRASYVGFTATPFANVFISYDREDEMLKDDLFPRDFIYALNAPSNYCGSRKYFFNDNPNVRIIKDANDDIFPMTHKKDWDGNKLFESVYHSINTFLIANAIRDMRDSNKNTNRSMLINMSRFTNVQQVIKEIVEEYFDKIKKNVKQCSKLDINYALTNPYIKSLKDSFDKEYSNIYHNGKLITWQNVFYFLYEAINKIKIIVVNSSKKSEKLSYDEKDGVRVIAIGGLALSRGLTLEGLCVSYFYRNTATFDVLMQMGRWFGYRDGYGDLCKIFITNDSREYYKDICESIDCLKEDIKKMGSQNKKPEDYGIRVRNDSIDLGITASNKMRNTKNKVDRKSFYGNIFETPYLHRDLKIIEHNIQQTISFIENISLNKRDKDVSQHPYFRNIPKKDILNLLNGLNIHEANESFDVRQIRSFLNRDDIELQNFDVLIIGGSSTNHFTLNDMKIDIPLVSRRFDIPNSNVIRMNAKRAHLWGRSDTKYGLSKNEQEQVTKDEYGAINDNVRAQDYLIEGRNPILIIYFINPDNHDSPSDNIDYGYRSEEFKLNLELLSSRYPYLVGYAIGFPNKKGENAKATLYTVNKTVNYYEKDHELEDEDGNE